MPVLDNGVAAREVRVDFYLDVICPWCWIGLRNLRAALDTFAAQQPGAPVVVTAHASTLITHIPPEGVPYQAFYENRLGGAEAVAARRAQVRAAAAAVGIQINYPAIETFPNTQLACALVNAAQGQLSPTAMFDFMESVFAAYFVQGKNIGQADTLEQLARDAGVAWAAQDAATASPHDAAPSGVPYYVFNDRWSLTGAVPSHQLVQGLEYALSQPDDAHQGTPA